MFADCTTKSRAPRIAGDDQEIDAVLDRDPLDRAHVDVKVGKDLDLHALAPTLAVGSSSRSRRRPTGSPSAS
jgi:hypothetical protein